LIKHLVLKKFHVVHEWLLTENTIFDQICVHSYHLNLKQKAISAIGGHLVWVFLQNAMLTTLDKNATKQKSAFLGLCCYIIK